MIVAAEFGRQFIFIGLVDGLSYALLALGVILIYRSDRVINFAVGAVGVLAAQIMARLVIEWSVPYWPSVIIAVAAGGAFFGVSQLIVGRRLANAPRVILLVATIGLAQLATVLALALPDPEARGADFPTPWAREFDIFGVRVSGAELVLFVVSAVLVTGIGLWMNRSLWGQAIRASAADPDRARLVGIDPGMMSTVVWTVTGAFAATVAVFQEADSNAFRVSTPGPALMVRVLTVAVVAGFVSFRRAVAAGLILGVAEALVRVNWTDDLGRFEAILLVVVVIAVWRMPSPSGKGEDSFSFAPRVRPMPESVKRIWWVRNHATLLGGAALAMAITVPLIVDQSSRIFLYSRILVLAIAALSLVVLTGWGGQVSLGQGAFAGIGALTTAALVNGQDVGLGIGSASVTVPIPELPFLVAVLCAVLVTAAVAMIIGLGALRIEGLLLAVVTLVFAVSADRFFYHRPFLSDGGDTGTTSVFLDRAAVGPIDLASQRNYYYLALGGLAITMVFIAYLRRTGIGRMIIAVRENPDAAAAATVSPTRAKLLAFGTAGGVAGFGGALLGGLLAIVLFEELSVQTSFELLAIAVIGGVGSVAGPVLGSLWVIGLPSFWPDNQLVPLLTSSLGLLILLMYAPGGFIQLWYLARDAAFRALEQRLPVEEGRPRPAVPAPTDDRPVLESDPLVATGIRVAFSGRVAVDGVDLTVAPGEIVGLIGTNGAGKTTLMNAVGGFVGASGSVSLFGQPVDGLSPAARHRLGMGRTFQAARLFGDLTVRETVLVGLEARHRTQFVTTALATPGARRTERARRSTADDLIGFLGLGDYADSFVGELSTGTRRIVELAGLLANDARLLCLDEPAGGVAQRETEALGPLLVAIRRELDAAMLVIEHDMPFLMGISHRVVALAEGQIIASGSPDEVRNDPAVIDSYLGTDERAVARSGTTDMPFEET